MCLHCRPKRWLCGWLIVLLLHTQFAIAAYACPAGLVAAPAHAALMAAMPGCDGGMAGTTDPQPPPLCRAHCQQGAQTIHPTPATDAPPTPVLWAVLDWAPAALLPSQPAGQAPMRMSGAAPPGAAPLNLRLPVLRN
jgi:hypothetical protein